MEDKYVVYVLEYGIDAETFWHSAIEDVERIVEGKLAFDAWKNNPM